MPALKTIQINPDALSISNRKTRKNKKKRERREKKKSSHIKPNTLKKALLRRIKEKAQQEKERSEHKIKKESNQNENSFSSDFEKHLSYLNNLSIQHKHKKKHKNKTLKTKSSLPENNITINTELPPELNNPPKPIATSTPFTLNPPVSPSPPSHKTVEHTQSIKVSSNNNKPAPPYSCLKGSNKPTYREWKKLTQKNMNNYGKKEDKSASDEENSKIDELRTRILDNNKKFERKPTSKIYRKKTIKRRYKFGKNNGKISVLVKNNKTRKMVQNEVELLRKAPIKEIKDYLRKHYLYKAGSNAPNDVLRKTYIDAHLSGEITNKSTETLVHNYINN